MKLLWLMLAFGLTLSVRAEIGVTDPTDLIKEPAAKKRSVQPIAPAKPSPVISPSQPLRQGPKEGLIRFRNGDLLHGDLVAITEAGQVDWQSIESKEPLRFSLNNVIQIVFPGAGQPVTGNALVTLTNGDNLRGDLVALDETNLTFDTSYAGPIKLRRVMVQRITNVSGGAAIVFEGFTSLDGWTKAAGANKWTLRSGVLGASQAGAISRDVGLPERCVIEFDFAWDRFAALHLGLYGLEGSSVLDGTATGYWFQFTPASIQLHRMRGPESTLIGQLEMRRFMQPGKTHVTIYVDQSKKTFTLGLDGQMLKTWTESADFAGTGTALNIVAADQPIRLSQLVVRQWTGELGGGGSVVAGKEDILTLANGDRVSGHLKSIRQGAANVVSSVTALDIPLERVAEIYLAGETAERARRRTPDVVGQLVDGSRVTMALDNLDERTVVGQSENFGKANFARAAFRVLHLQIYDEDRGPESGQDDTAAPHFLQ